MMKKPTKADLSAINATLENRLMQATSRADAGERDLINLQREFDAYRKRYSPVPKQTIIRWFSMAVTGTTEEVLLRAYLQTLLDVMMKYGEDDPRPPSIADRLYPKGDQ